MIGAETAPVASPGTTLAIGVLALAGSWAHHRFLPGINARLMGDEFRNHWSTRWNQIGGAAFLAFVGVTATISGLLRILGLAG